MVGPMLDGLDGRVALVTGGSGGIGRAPVRRLAAERVAVAVGYGAGAEAAKKIVAEIVTEGGRAVAVGADLRRPDAPGALIADVEAALGSVDVLVNNAGMGRIQSLEEVRCEDFDEMVAVNLRAPFDARAVPSTLFRVTEFHAASPAYCWEDDAHVSDAGALGRNDR